MTILSDENHGDTRTYSRDRIHRRRPRSGEGGGRQSISNYKTAEDTNEISTRIWSKLSQPMGQEMHGPKGLFNIDRSGVVVPWKHADDL